MSTTALLALLVITATADPIDHDEAIRRVKPSVVKLVAKSTLNSLFDRLEAELPNDVELSIPAAAREQSFEQIGSGVVIDDDGHVITTASFAATDAHLTATLIDGRTVDARLVGVDITTDLAVLRLVDAHPKAAVLNTDPASLKPGMPLCIVSSAASTCSSTTDGQLAEVRLNSGAGVVHDFLRLRADAIPGSAGGAVVNSKGQVVGMVAARRGNNSTLAVPAATLQRVAKAILSGVSIRRALLGVTVFAPVGGSGTDRGVQVYGVVPDGPADRSGIQSGDLLFTYEGQKITDVSSLKKLVFDSEPSSPVEISLFREQQRVTVRVQLGERSSGPPGQIVIRVSVPYLGVVPGDAIDAGVLVSDTTAASPAALAGVRPGDILTGIGDNCVESSDMLRRVVRSYHSGARLTLKLVRDGKKITTNVVLSSRTAEAVIPGYDVPLLPREWEKESVTKGDAPRVRSRIQPVSFEGRTPSNGPLRSLHDQLEGARK